jgi:hypothetical protein
MKGGRISMGIENPTFIKDLGRERRISKKNKKIYENMKY